MRPNLFSKNPTQRYLSLAMAFLFVVLPLRCSGSAAPTPVRLTYPDLPAHVTQITVGTALEDCQVKSPLAVPVILPADTAQIAYQVTFDESYTGTRTVSFDSGLIPLDSDTHCLALDGINFIQAFQGKDGAPLPLGQYSLSVGNGEQTLEIPIRVLAPTEYTVAEATQARVGMEATRSAFEKRASKCPLVSPGEAQLGPTLTSPETSATATAWAWAIEECRRRMEP